MGVNSSLQSHCIVDRFKYLYRQSMSKSSRYGVQLLWNAIDVGCSVSSGKSFKTNLLTSVGRNVGDTAIAQPMFSIVASNGSISRKAMANC